MKYLFIIIYLNNNTILLNLIYSIHYSNYSFNINLLLIIRLFINLINFNLVLGYSIIGIF